MDGWRVDPRVARDVLTRALADVHDGMRTAMHAAATSIEQAHTAVGPDTQAALLSLGSDLFEVRIAATRSRLHANISAVSSAIDAYERGDEQMAAAWAKKPQ